MITSMMESPDGFLAMDALASVASKARPSASTGRIR
jgi:hypothetical protein